MASNTAKLSIDELRWSQAMIYDHFSHDGDRPGLSIFETIVQLLLGSCSINDIPAMRVMEYDGKYYSLGNRRLKALKLYDTILRRHGLKSAPLQVPVRLASRPPANPLTTINDGIEIDLIRPKRIRFQDWRLKQSEIEQEAPNSASESSENELASVTEDFAEKFSCDFSVPLTTVGDNIIYPKDGDADESKSVIDSRYDCQKASDVQDGVDTAQPHKAEEIATMCEPHRDYSLHISETKVNVPAHAVGRVVGAGRANLQALQSMPGMESVNLISDGIGYDAVLVINGTDDALKETESRIMEKIEQSLIDKRYDCQKASGAQDGANTAQPNEAEDIVITRVPHRDYPLQCSERTVNIPAHAVGRVVGTGRAHLQALQSVPGMESVNLISDGIGNDAVIVIAGTDVALKETELRIMEKIGQSYLKEPELTKTISIPKGAIGVVKGKHAKNLKELQATPGLAQARLSCKINAAEDAELILSGSAMALERASMRIQALLDKFITGGRRRNQEQLHFEISHLSGVTFASSSEFDTLVDFTAHGCTELSVLRPISMDPACAEVGQQNIAHQHALLNSIEVFIKMDVDAMKTMFGSVWDHVSKLPKGTETKLVARLGALHLFAAPSEALPAGSYAPLAFQSFVPYKDYQLQYSGNLKIPARSLESQLKHHGFRFIAEKHASVVHVLDGFDGAYSVTFEETPRRASHTEDSLSMHPGIDGVGESETLEVAPPNSSSIHDDSDMLYETKMEKCDVPRITRFMSHKKRQFDASVVKDAGKLGFRISCTTEQAADNHDIRSFIENAWAEGGIKESGRLAALGSCGKDSCHIKSVRFNEEWLFMNGNLEASVQNVRSKQLETSGDFVTFPELEISSPALNNMLLDLVGKTSSNYTLEEAVRLFVEIVHMAALLATSIQEKGYDYTT